MSSAPKRLAANTVASALGQMTAMGVAFLLAPLLIGAFGPQGFGAYTLVASVSAFMLLFDLGLGQTIEKQLAEYTAVGKLAEAGALLASVRRTYLGIGLAVAAVELALAALAPQVFRLSEAEVTLVRQLLWVAAMSTSPWNAAKWSAAPPASRCISAASRFSPGRKKALTATCSKPAKSATPACPTCRRSTN